MYRNLTSINLSLHSIGVVKQTRAIHTLSCSKVSRILDWNCKLKGFEERKFALKDSNGKHQVVHN